MRLQAPAGVNHTISFVCFAVKDAQASTVSEHTPLQKSMQENRWHSGQLEYPVLGCLCHTFLLKI